MFLHYTLEIGKCQLVGGIFCNFHMQSHMLFVQIEYIYEKTNLDTKNKKKRGDLKWHVEMLTATLPQQAMRQNQKNRIY